LDYQTVPKVTSVPTGAYCYFFCTRVVQVLREVFHVDISFICWLRVIRILFFLFWDFAAEEVDGVGDKGPGIPQQLMYIHSWRAFWTCSWDIPVSLMSLLTWKSKTSGLAATLTKCWIVRISELLDIWD